MMSYAIGFEEANSSSNSVQGDPEILPLPLVTLNSSQHRLSFKRKVVDAMDDIVSDFPHISLFLKALPLVVLAEVWRDGALKRSVGPAHWTYAFQFFSNLLPLLLFVAITNAAEPPSDTQRIAYLGPSMVEVLPQEIVDIIIDHLVPDLRHRHCGSRYSSNTGWSLRTFSSYSLVCKAFLPRARFHLFSSFVIRSSTYTDVYMMNFLESDQIRADKLLAVARTVQDRSQLIESIRHVQIFLSPGSFQLPHSYEHIHMQTLLGALQPIARIQSLCLDFQFWTMSPPVHLSSLLLTSPLLMNITSLHIKDVWGFPLDFIGGLTSLRDLSLSSCRVIDDRTPKGSSVLTSIAQPQLRSLTLKSSSLSALRLAGLALDTSSGGYNDQDHPFLDLSHLVELDITWEEFEDRRVASETLLRTYGGTVTSFTYDFYICPESVDGDFDEVSGLCALQELNVIFELSWGLSNSARTARAARMAEDASRCNIPVSLAFLIHLLRNVSVDAPLRTLNILCPRMDFYSTMDPDPEMLILSLEWRRLDSEIYDLYNRMTQHRMINDVPLTKLTVNLRFTLSLRYPGAITYKDGQVSNRAEMNRWTKRMAHKYRRLMEEKLRREFPRISESTNITLDMTYTLES